MEPIRRLADNIIRYRSPTDTAKTVLDQAYLTANSGTISFTAYDEQKESILAQPSTRLRSDVTAGNAVWTIPHIVPAWIEDGDSVEIFVDKGFSAGSRWHRTIVTTNVAGTDEDTESTNFDTLTVATPVTEALLAGTVLRLRSKGAAANNIPYVSKSREIEALDTLEIETVVLETLENVSVTGSGSHETYASEDGAPAVNQETVKVIVVANTTGILVVGARIRRHFGAAVVMTSYGEQSPPVFADWTSTDPEATGGGFEGVFASELAGIRNGDSLRIEITFDPDSVVPLRDVVSILTPVIEQ